MTAAAARGVRRLRLFFALWPDPARRAALAAAAAEAVSGAEGEPVPPGNLHVTLAFLGGVPGRRLAAVLEVGGQGPWPAVDLEFGRIEYWTRPKVVVALPRAVPDAAREIVDRLWKSLAPLEFERDARTWQPHLTLMRRVRRPPPEGRQLGALAPASGARPWCLALVESTAHVRGVRYRPIADWPLGQEGTVTGVAP